MSAPMTTPHHVRTLVRLTEEQHDWLVNLGKFWIEEYPDLAEWWVRHDGEVNVSSVIRQLIDLAATNLPAAEVCPWPAD